jgi:hypothetical protein
MMHMKGGHGEHGDPHGGMGAHMMHMKGGHGEHGDPHGGMGAHMMHMKGGHGEHGDPHGGMGAHMMHMKGGHGEHGDPHECHGGRSDHEEIPEEIQFIDELSLLHEVSVSMSDSSMALLGIHMIRDGLEPENRLEALEVIISKSSKGSSSRNAAIITAIETMRELDMMDEAADLMIELVLSN